MAIKFSGEFQVKKQPEEVYDFLTDPNRFAPLLPEFQSVSVQDPTHFAVKVNVGISYIKGSADVKMELAEADRPRRAQYKGQGAVGGGNVTMVAGFDLAPVADGVAPGTADGTVLGTTVGTKVNWQGEAQIFGRLASVAGGLLEPLGRKQIQKLIDGLQAALA
ncbi:MAG: SRPBCC family protein [Acidobacteriia bacterium]|nr:SRPBCC family protein [Terriglobia bacterium]